MKNKITLNDLSFDNKKFWYGFIASAFVSIAYDPETDVSLADIIEDNKLADTAWWDQFTGYYDDVIEDADGYVDDPRTLLYDLAPTQTLKIEFHPGDIVYSINDCQIGCTGGEYQLQVFPFADLLKYVDEIKDNRIFLLLLPLTTITKQDLDQARQKLSYIFGVLIDNTPVYRQITNSIIYGLLEE